MARGKELGTNIEAIERLLTDTDPFSKKIADVRRDPNATTVYLMGWTTTSFPTIEPRVSLIATMTDALPDYQLVRKTNPLSEGENYTKLYFQRVPKKQGP